MSEADRQRQWARELNRLVTSWPAFTLGDYLAAKGQAAPLPPMRPTADDLVMLEGMGIRWP